MDRVVLMLDGWQTLIMGIAVSILYVCIYWLGRKDGRDETHRYYCENNPERLGGG